MIRALHLAAAVVYYALLGALVGLVAAVVVGCGDGGLTGTLGTICDQAVEPPTELVAQADRMAACVGVPSVDPPRVLLVPPQACATNGHGDPSGKVSCPGAKWCGYEWTGGCYKGACNATVMATNWREWSPIVYAHEAGHAIEEQWAVKLGTKDEHDRGQALWSCAYGASS